MAYATFKQSGSTADLLETSATPRRPHNLLIGGAAVTVSNPYWTVWWLTAGLALLLMSTKAGVAGVITFFIGHISADFLWFGFVGFLVAWGGRMLSGKVYRRILQACAVFMLVFGVLFGIYGVRMVHSTMFQ
jgi:threonine/homoserine/homoserine lactone efflux protein